MMVKWFDFFKVTILLNVGLTNGTVFVSADLIEDSVEYTELELSFLTTFFLD